MKQLARWWLLALVLPGPLQAEGSVAAEEEQSANVWVDVELAPDKNGTCLLVLDFHRADPSRNRLVVAVLTLGTSRDDGLAKIVSDPTKTHLGMMTGWFLAADRNELWIGLYMKAGAADGELVFEVPTPFVTSSGYPTEHTFRCIRSSPTVNLSSDAAALDVATVRQVCVRVPEFLQASRADGWSDRGVDPVYCVDMMKLAGSAPIVLREVPDWIALWLKDKLSVFGGWGAATLGVLLSVLAYLAPRRTRLVIERLVIGLIGIGLGIASLYAATWSARTALFETANVLGVALAATLAAAIPASYYPKLGELFRRIRSVEVTPQQPPPPAGGEDMEAAKRQDSGLGLPAGKPAES